MVNSARIHSIETFGTVDGPGVRYVLFLKGCPLRCLYCHNPDTWEHKTENTKTVAEIMEDIKKYYVFIKKSGGVTVSGGEPLLQIDFIIELFKELKKDHIHTCIDTSGIISLNQQKEKVDELIRLTDLFIIDIKQIDNEKHKKLTGVPNKGILEFIKYVDEHQKPLWIRHVLVPGYTTDEVDLRKLKKFIDGLSNVEKIEVIPYHTLGVYKYEGLGIEYPLKGINPPTKTEIDLAKKILNL